MVILLPIYLAQANCFHFRGLEPYIRSLIVFSFCHFFNNSQQPESNISHFQANLQTMVACWFVFVSHLFLLLSVKTGQSTDERNNIRGTQRPLNIALLNVFQYLNGRFRHNFNPSKFFICSDFLPESLVIRKLQGSKLTFSKMSARKKAPENSR